MIHNEWWSPATVSAGIRQFGPDCIRRRASCPSRLRGSAFPPRAAQAASWKMIPAAIRSPARTGLTPWRMTTRCTPRAPRARWTQPALRGILADGPKAQADINWLYQVTLGRPADPAGLATQQAALAAGQNQAQIRVALAQSPEEAAFERSVACVHPDASPASPQA